LTDVETGEVVGLEGILGASGTLIELATRLGRACLDDERLLEENMKETVVSDAVERLAGLVREVDADAWESPSADGLLALLGSEDVRRVLHRLATLDPAGHLGILRGLCANPLDRFFEQFRGRLALTRGIPLPNATRPVQKLFGASTTPRQQTMSSTELLGRIGFDLFRESDPTVSVTLDFSHSERLDELTWVSEKLPRVGTVHPRLSEGRLAYTLDGDRVFDVHQKDWSLRQTLEHLEAVRDAQIVLLPELCLPSPDALEESLAADPSRYSPIVVAGSAHDRVQEDGERRLINESRVYVDGVLVLHHRKIRPLETQRIGNHRSDQMIREDLSPSQHQITLLSGERTRMAVVICADLNRRLIPRVLEDCGVNLLLVPSLTFRTGAFNGAVCLLASNCQALCVVANPVLDRLEDERCAPFLVLAAVPRSGAKEQSHEYFLTPGQTEPRAILDPNLALASALQWT
jgi:predicted amidohydrolase